MHLRGASLRWSGSIDESCQHTTRESLAGGHISGVSNVATSRGFLSWSLKLQRVL